MRRIHAHRPGRALGLAAALMATVGLLPAGPALAQQNEAGVESQASQSFQIPAGPLSRALNSLARQAGLALTFEPELTRGKTTEGLSGDYTPSQALEQLLLGSGLSYRFTQGKTVTLVAKNSQEGDGPLRLAPIQVAGDEAEGFRAETSNSAGNVNASLIETPATVNVITRELMDKLAFRGFEESMQYVAGASAENAGDPFSPKFNLRGFTVNSLTSGGVYADGYQAVRRGYHFDSSLYERVDVLKGTSAVMYGLATPGGIVNYIAKKPQSEAAVRLEGSVGSFDTRRASLDATGALNASGSLAYRVILTGQSANQTVNGDNSDGSFDDRVVFSPSLLWQTPGGGHLYASYEYSNIESVFDPGVKRLDSGEILFETDPFVGPESGFDRELHKGKIEWVKPLAQNWELLLGGVLTRSDNVSNIDASFFGNLDGEAMPRWTAKSLEDYEQTEIRAELSGEWQMTHDIHHSMTLGANYLDTEVSVDRASVTTSGVIDPFAPEFGPGPELPEPVFWFDIGSEPETNIYLQDYIQIKDKLKLFAGVSYSDFEIFREHAVAADFHNSESSFNWDLGVIFNYNDYLNPFISYSTSTEPQREVNAPREGEQIEAGLKSRWLGERLTTTLSLFQIDQSDKAEEVPSNSGQFRLVGDQRTRGVEFEAVGRISDQLRLIGNYSYLDADFNQSTTGNEGNRPHSVPENKVSLFGEYAFRGRLEGLQTGLGFIHVGERYGDNANTFELPDYERVDLYLGYQRGAYDVKMTLENLFDEDYILGSGGSGHELAQGATRFLTLSVGYEF